MANKELKKVELWEGYEVTVDDSLFKDADYLEDFSRAQSNNNLSEMVTMMLALVCDGDPEKIQKIHDDIRAHIVEEVGYFDVDKLGEILNKIGDVLPKAGKRAPGRLWRTSK